MKNLRGQQHQQQQQPQSKCETIVNNPSRKRKAPTETHEFTIQPTAVRTRSKSRSECLDLLAKTLPILLQTGFLSDTEDLFTLCITNPTILEILRDNDLWKIHYSNLYIYNKPIPLHKLLCKNYTNFFLEKMRFHHQSLAFIQQRMNQIRLNPSWRKQMHYAVECGICGCNCEQCLGIPISSQYRYERIDLRLFEHAPDEIRRRTRRFCQGCFENTLDLPIIQREVMERSYVKCEKQMLLDALVEEIGHGSGKERWCEWMNSSTRVIADEAPSPPFFQRSTNNNTWFLDYEVDKDEVAVVIAYALMQPNCRYEYLDVSALHHCCLHCSHGAGFGCVGYKALAIALSVNTSLKTIVFSDDCATCKLLLLDDCAMKEREEMDVTNGLFAKALKYNVNSGLKKMVVCPRGFGANICKELVALKPDLVIEMVELEES